MTFPFETVTATGDHGSITFRKSDGVVVARDFDSGYENDPNAGYPFILWANPETLTQDPTDILRVGYYYKDKNGLISYEPPIEPEELTADPLPTPEKPMKPFDLEKAKAGAPVVQRCGRHARIVDFALKNEAYPLAVIYTDDMGREHLTEFSIEGKYYGDQSDTYRDLMMAPVKREGWVNLYPPTMSNGVLARATSVYATKGQAEVNASPTRITCVRIEWWEE